MPQGSTLSPFLFILYTSEMFELVENRLYAYADDSTLLAVVRKPADKPAVAASLNRDLARIGVVHMMLNQNTTKALVVSRSRTVNPPYGDLRLSGVSICASPILDILGEKFDSRLTFEDHVRVIVSRVSQRIGVLRLVKHRCGHRSVLLRCYYASVLPILEYCSPVWGLLLNVIFSNSSARCIRWPGFALIRLSYRCVIDVMLLHCECWQGLFERVSLFVQ